MLAIEKIVMMNSGNNEGGRISNPFNSYKKINAYSKFTELPFVIAILEMKYLFFLYFV